MINVGLVWKAGPKYARLKKDTKKWDDDQTYEPIDIKKHDFEAFEISDGEIEEKGPPGEYARLRHVAVTVSWVSVIFSFITGVGAIILGQLLNSESLFGYGLDAVLDSLSSVAVLWRFYSNCVSEAAEAKERKACVVISVFFFASSISLLFKSIKSITKGSRDDASHTERIVIDCFSGMCSLVTLVLGIIKVIYGRRLQSKSLVTDSIITFVGSAMGFFTVVSLELYEADDRIWYLDSIFGIVCAVFLLFFGIKLLIQMTCLYKHTDEIKDES